MDKRKVQVSVFYCDDNGDKYFLLLKTNKSRGNFWQNITGGVDEGESFVDGAKRELIEETSIKDFKIIETDMCFTFLDQWNLNCTEKCYFAKVPSRVEVTIDPSEHEDYKWVKFNDITPQTLKHITNYNLIQRSKEL